MLQWAVKNSKGREHFERLVQTQQQGNLIAVTNGSFKKNRGAAARACSISHNQQVLTPHSPEPQMRFQH